MIKKIIKAVQTSGYDDVITAYMPTEALISLQLA